MHRRAVKYKAVFVAPSSDLFKALEEGKTHKAQQIYKECLRDERELLKNAKALSERYRNPASTEH